MNYIIDAILLLCLVWGAFTGIRKGLIKQFFSMSAVILGIWGGFTFAGKLVTFLKEYFQQLSDVAGLIIAFITIFLVIQILSHITSVILTKIIDATVLGIINRLAGAVLGILSIAFVLSIIILFFNRLNDKKKFIEQQTIEKTYLYKPIGKIAPTILPEKWFKNF